MKDQERELKTLLTSDQARQLASQNDFGPAFSQINTYYDSPDHLLKNQGMALRIRQVLHPESKDEYILTLKKPLDAITKYEYERPVQAHTLGQLNPEEKAWLNQYIHLPEDIEPVAEFKTDRQICQSKDADLCLDHTFFKNHDDYEAEYEYRQDHDGINRFRDILSAVNAKYEKNCPSKIARAAADLQK